MTLKHDFELGVSKVEPSNLEIAGAPRQAAQLLALKEATYFVHSPYQKTLKSLREAIKEEGLKLPMQMDVAERIRNELGIGLRPCTILCIYCSYLLLQAAIWDRGGAGFLPLRIVVSGSTVGTKIHLPGPLDAGLPVGLRVAFEEFLARVVKVLARVGAKRSDRPISRWD